MGLKTARRTRSEGSRNILSRALGGTWWENWDSTGTVTRWEVRVKKEKGEECSKFLAFFVRSSISRFLFDVIILCRIKFRETQQKVITFVATTFKPLLTVAKANGGLSGCELHTGNVYNLFWNILIHISPLLAYKKGAQPKPRTEKAQAPIAAKQTFDK